MFVDADAASAAVRNSLEVHLDDRRRATAVGQRSAGSGHFDGVLCLSRGCHPARRHSLALRGRALREEAGRSVAP